MSSKISPRVRVEPATRVQRLDSGNWLTGWTIENQSDQPLEIVSAWLPHSRFRAEVRQFAKLPNVLPGESVHVEFVVTCSEPPGAVVENAFLILRARWNNQSWRIFARLRIVIAEQGQPHPLTELITTQATHTLA